MTIIDIESSREDVLSARAEKYAAMPNDLSEKTIIDSVVVLQVGRQSICISSKCLEMIAKTPSIAHVPGLPPLVSGVIQHRGELLAAVDIAQWFNIDTDENGTFFAVAVHSSGRKLALLVDRVQGFRDIAASDLVESFLQNDGREKRPIRSATRDLIAVIDIDMVFESDEIRAVPSTDKRR